MGTHGSLDFPNLTLWKSVSGESCWNNPIKATELSTDKDDAYINQLLQFGEVIRGDAVPRISAEDATATLRATLAVYESATTGSKVQLRN